MKDAKHGAYHKREDDRVESAAQAVKQDAAKGNFFEDSREDGHVEEELSRGDAFGQETFLEAFEHFFGNRKERAGEDEEAGGNDEAARNPEKDSGPNGRPIRCST